MDDNNEGGRGRPMTVRRLLEALDGLDPEAPVVVGIINGPAYDAAYAEQQVRGGTLSAYICCYEEPRAWEGPPPALNEDGTATLEYDPEDEDPDAGGEVGQ